ncbi:MAG: peptidase S41, partial [Comamonas sp.]
GSDKDFQLQQALNKLKGQPVQVSKTLTERKAEDKSEDAAATDKKPAVKKSPEKSESDKSKK